MTGALLLAVVLSLPTVESQAETMLREKFESIGRRMPARDPRLEMAAKTLSQVALSKGSENAVGFLEVTESMSDAKGWDPSPVVIVLKGRGQSLLDALSSQPISRDAPASHFGMALAPGDGDYDALCILFVRRVFELDAFSRKWTKPGSVTFCGTPLSNNPSSAELFVTLPSGAVESRSMRRDKRGFCGTLELSRIGRHTIEVIAKGERGPEVVALFFVNVGDTQSQNTSVTAESSNADEARTSIEAAVNRLRAQFDLRPLERDSSLEQVAQAFAVQLDSEHFFAHVAPDGSTLKDRLKRADYAYLAAGENLGLAQGPMAAHFGIEHSPGHRQNLLDPRFQRLGLGLVKSAAGRWTLVEVLAQPESSSGQAAKDPRDVIMASLNSIRARKGLPPLKRHGTLDNLAQSHALAAQQWGHPQVEIPNERPLPERVFELMDDAASASVDVFSSESLSLTPSSKNLGDRNNRWVGIGVVQPTAKNHWIVVLYAAPRR